MDGRPLERLELLTLAHKDEQYYRDWLGNDVQALLQNCGTRRWIQFRDALTVLSRFGYFGINMLTNNPTPGEEFCQAQPVTGGILQKLLTILLNNELRPPKGFPQKYAFLAKNVHLISFLFFGDFAEIAKRATNYFYSTLDTETYQTKRMKYLFQFAGLLSLAKLLIHMAKQESIEAERSETSKNLSINLSTESVKKDSPSSLCHLCSETRVDPTSTLCGHIFCWTCIHKWLKERSECPVCRTPTEPSRLIYLVNFK